ncbi:hypothetical protein IG631_20051 [Alternaria alternata]|nr:hypothetical protein IG631_20051 [Alternaria alternata]
MTLVRKECQGPLGADPLHKCQTLLAHLAFIQRPRNCSSARRFSSYVLSLV